MPRIWYFQKILAAGYQLCWSRGTWSSVSPLSSPTLQCQYFASGALVCSYLNFWHPLAACEQSHYCHSWMIFFIEPLESEEPVSCLELRELSPGISLPRVLERSTCYVLPSTLKTSEFTSDKWLRMDLPVPARILPEWGWGSWPAPGLWKAGLAHAWFHPTKECGCWPGAAVPPWNRHQASVGLHKPWEKPVWRPHTPAPHTISNNPSTKFGFLLRLFSCISQTRIRAALAGERGWLHRRILHWDVPGSVKTWVISGRKYWSFTGSVGLNQRGTAHPGRHSKCFVRQLVQYREPEKVPRFGLVLHTESFQITSS